MGNPNPRADRRALVAAILVAMTAAAFQYALFLPHGHELWSDPVHDRNAHYFFGLTLAQDARGGDVLGFLKDVNTARVWPPLHGLLLAGVLTVTGCDPRFAVLPSLGAWAGLLVAAFVLARRIVPGNGNLAGFAALLFTLASPAHRAFATDVMLESLGVCLSLWSLERYVALRQAPSFGTGRGLALVLLALFLTKFNYWVLVVAGLAVTEILARPALVLGLATGLRNGCGPRAWRDPLLLLALLSLVGAGVLTAFAPLKIGPVRIDHGGDLAGLALALLLVRVLLWRYRGAGRVTWPTLAPAARAVLAWGVLPVAVWFALPGRLAAFLWLGLAAHGENPDYSLSSRAGKMLGWLQSDYHASLVALLLIVALALVAIASLRRLRPGAAVLVVFLAAAALLTVEHPNSKARFLMNWLPALWVLAGVGMARLPLPRFAPGAALVLVAGLCLPAVWWPGHAEEAGLRPGATSLLPLAEAYLEQVRPGERTAVLATAPIKFFTQWTYRQTSAMPRDRDLEGRGWLPLETGRLDAFTAWLDATHCETVVLLDIEKGSPFAGGPGWTGGAILARWRATQHQFTPVASEGGPALGATVRVFRRDTLARR